MEVARLGGLVDFEPVTARDALGRDPVLELRTHLFGDEVAIDAIEFLADEAEGYRFQVIGDAEDDLMVLLARLVEKMRRALARSHLDEGELGLQISDPGIVRARIESDIDGQTDMPAVVIDGRSISWHEFGRMLSAYTGFQFRLELQDISDEV